MQGVGYNQNAHYALVKALSDGTAVIDDKLGELGELSTRDISRYRGHFYSNKAPGLAFLTMPLYVVLEAAGARTLGAAVALVLRMHPRGNRRLERRRATTVPR